MKEWYEVKACHRCGWQFEISEHMAMSMEYKLKKDGKLSKKYTMTEPCSIGEVTAYCYGCQAVFDSDCVNANFETGILELKY